ncbi:MAG: hypothetical protein EOL88_08475 [Bacteroidia bacterium]|nr:hypothetical protein [Bacteroidia bacterium]
MNFDGSYSGAIFQWFDNEDYIELPLFYFDINPVVFFDLFLSPVSTFQYFNHYDLIFNNNKATIILCDNFVLSEKINIIISESKRVDYSVFVAISFEYNGKSSLENCIDVLHDRDVVYIPNASNKSFSNLQFIEKVKEVASSFRIQKKLIFFDDASSKPSLLPEFDFLATYFVNSAVKIDEHGSGIVFDIVKFSVLYEEYLDWCRYVGLLNDVVAFDEISFLELDKISRSFDIDNLRPCFESLFSYPNITLLYGLQRSSKSIFLLTILYAISAGFDVFDLNVFNSKRVLLIDFFANSDSFINRLYSIHLPYLKNKPLCSNFYSILMSDVKFAEKFDFLSAKFQKFIEKHVVESRCEIIAFDNFPFTSEQGDYFVKDFGKIFEWLRYIQNKYSIGICISYEQSSGRDIFLNQLADYKFSNIIKINQHKSFDFENSHPSINQGSLENTISVQYEYISNYMSLNKTEACFCKPHANNLVDSKWIKLQNKLTKNDFVIDKKSKHSSYETIVLKYMKDNKNRDFFLRDEIDKLLNKKPGTSRIVLNNLINKELVRKIGSNPRSIKYEYIGP